MDCRGRTSGVGLFVFLCLLLYPCKAYAYIDPATGSYITQIVIAVLVGGLFVIKQYFSRIREFIRNLVSRERKSEE